MPFTAADTASAGSSGKAVPALPLLTSFDVATDNVCHIRRKINEPGGPA
jgi:hypothetical protein